MTSGPARICCLDLDTFFVSVERLFDPNLVGRPVVVGGLPGQRGVVTAASYEVRAFGVKSGMSMAEAVRLCPQAVFLPTRHGVYGPFAERVRAVLERYTPEVQTASIDEFFLDFRGCEGLLRQPSDPDDDATILRVVDRMRQEIADEVGLPASAGIGATRAVAKIASGLAKPRGTVLVPPDQARAVLGPLTVRKYPGIGPVTSARLEGEGITTLGQLLDLPPGPARMRFQRLADMVARGLLGGERQRLGRDRPAFREHDPEGLDVGSVSNERTFLADVDQVEQVHDQLRALTERVCWRVRKRGIQARTVAVKVRTSDFHTVSRARTVPATNDEALVYATVRELLDRAWDRRLPVRLLGVELSHLCGPDRQLDLPFAGAAHRPAVGAALDRVRQRFGYDAIRMGATGPGREWNA